MGLHHDIRELLVYLSKNPSIRNQIRAERDRTLLYAGNFFKPVWKEIYDYRRAMGLAHDKTILPDILEKIRLPDAPYSTFKEWLEELDKIQPWVKNGYIAWRALSGIFASNAKGKVSFMIGGGVTKANKKVFAATEIHVLNRNPQIDPVTKSAVQYYLRCIQSGDPGINTGVILG